jgi:hypothetical protein
VLVHKCAAPGGLVTLWPDLAGSREAYLVAACSVFGDISSSRQDDALHDLNQVPAEQLHLRSVLAIREHGFRSQQNAFGEQDTGPGI